MFRDTSPDTSPDATRVPSGLQSQLDGLINITVDPRGGISIDGGNEEDDQDDQGQDRRPLYLRHDFDENLAEHMTGPELAALANHLQQGIDADKSDRMDWEQTAAAAIEWLGTQITRESGQDGADAGTLSNIWDPMLCNAVTRFWANAVGEFLPAAGPAKVRDDSPPGVSGMSSGQAGIGPSAGPPNGPLPSNQPNGQPNGAPSMPSRSDLAQAFELDLNHYLTTRDRSYYRDFSRMLMSLGLTGTQFRKIYWCPLRGRPVSEWVKAADLIVSSDATDLSTAARVTQIIKTSQANARRLQRSGWWRDVPLMTPFEQQSEIERAESDAEGIQRNPTLPDDHRHTIQECYLELDLAGFEHTDEDGEPTGIPLPYRVALDKDSRQIVEVRRNWRDGDPLFQPRQRFVMFGLIPGLSFYYLGFAHILGNGQLTLTSIRRQLLDAGCFANFPGFLIAKGMTRQTVSDLMVEPGQGREIDTMGKPLRDVVMNLPYQGPNQVLMALASELSDSLMKLAGVAEVPVGEGTADVPVGTVIAMIEQATKVTAACHKGLHASRAEELEMLRELIAEDPTVLTAGNRKPARLWEKAEEFEDLDLVPSSDPNVPSQLHRVMQAWALVQMAQGMPGVLDPRWVATNALRTIGFDLPQEAFAPPAPAGPPPGPPPDPAKMAMAQAQMQRAQIMAQDTQRKAAEATVQAENDRASDALDAQNAAAERESKERIAGMQEQTERLRLAAETAKAAHEASLAERQHQLRAAAPSFGGAGIVGGGSGGGAGGNSNGGSNGFSNGANQ